LSRPSPEFTDSCFWPGLQLNGARAVLGSEEMHISKCYHREYFPSSFFALERRFLQPHSALFALSLFPPLQFCA
jgi:hypothetical protein